MNRPRILTLEEALQFINDDLDFEFTILDHDTSNGYFNSNIR